MLRGEAIVWYHAHILLDAIYMVGQGIRRENHDALVKEYTRTLDALHPPLKPTTESLSQCATYFCQGSKIECYDDYRPRWSERLSLRNQVVNNNSWTWSNASLGPWQITAGYLDTAVSFDCKGNACGALSVKISVSVHPNIMLVGGGIKTSADFFIDLNVKKEAHSNYVMPLTAKNWTNFNNMDKHPAVMLTEIPGGEHILSIKPRGDAGSDTEITLTHLMSWVAV
jgi:hypothetical protein